MRQLLHYVSLFLTSCLFWTDAAAAQDIPKDLNAYGEVYVNACKVTERKALKASLATLKERDTEKLWQAIDMLLCAPATPANERQARQLLASKVKTIDEATGSGPEVQNRRPTLELVREVMAKGKAWGARVQSHENGVVVQYWPNEACVASVTLTYHGKKWWISQAGSACD